MTYIGNTDDDRRAMLSAIGVEGMDDLFRDIPRAHKYPALSLPPALSELEALDEVARLAGANTAGGKTVSFLGAGAYNHFIPSVVDYLSGRGEFATAYTPYQAEASQGTVQAIYEYQCMVADLVGMDVVNASHYDGATALAEAAIMSVRCARNRGKVVVAGSVHPEYLDVIRTYLAPQGIEIVVVDVSDGEGSAVSRLASWVDEETACLVVQNPDFFGRLADLAGLADEVHQRGAYLVIHVDPIATALFKSPGALGADIVTGEGQPLGIPLSFGGPYLGIFATRRELVRKMPGRVAGETVDDQGRRGFVLTLNTREQHIRREKATSNICTNQGLMALRAAVYLAAMGPEGLREAATLCHQKAHYAARSLAAIPGCTVNNGSSAPFFKEFVLTTPVPARRVVDLARASGVIPGVPLDTYFPSRPNDLLVAVTERNTREEIDRLSRAVGDAVATTKGAAAPGAAEGSP